MMFHIGEVPGYPDATQEKDPAQEGFQTVSNRKMIQANLYTLCLNALMSPDENEDVGTDSL